VAAAARPVTAPSANPPGAVPPRTLAGARDYFGDRVAAYVEGGALAGGASTVAAIEGDRVRVLRHGLVDEVALARALEGWRGMAAVSPLRAVRYDPSRSGELRHVIAPPYDVISPQEQAALYDRSPHNVVRLILARETPRADSAARALAAWVEERVL